MCVLNVVKEGDRNGRFSQSRERGHMRTMNKELLQGEELQPHQGTFPSWVESLNIYPAGLQHCYGPVTTVVSHVFDFEWECLLCIFVFVLLPLYTGCVGRRWFVLVSLRSLDAEEPAVDGGARCLDQMLML